MAAFRDYIQAKVCSLSKPLPQFELISATEILGKTGTSNVMSRSRAQAYLLVGVVQILLLILFEMFSKYLPTSIYYSVFVIIPFVGFLLVKIIYHHKNEYYSIVDTKIALFAAAISFTCAYLITNPGTAGRWTIIVIMCLALVGGLAMTLIWSKRKK
ncbi:hypothetical protein [Sandaracinobacteroides saxicola]|uniref:Uncharacterized protein n=1 Tax=Sandaracinobacteroides saxicola TaxID=2759707 RepID=A0A7G5II14_9SPHN|nr:hypothetical protein [Sandaracinobacteroides saxicola]QMW23006.1 hypothetical protein H3309_00365 [Sandaracinobacteroides saxicola]